MTRARVIDPQHYIEDLKGYFMIKKWSKKMFLVNLPAGVTVTI
jgi:hypothetical protein